MDKKEIERLNIIAYIRSDFPSKFGLPRQSGLVNDLRSYIVFEKEYSVEEAFRGLEDFSHIWILWGFSESNMAKWSPTVRPPRLGGNKRMGVFATRSPYRPNSIGLSCVEICEIKKENGCMVIEVRGADLMDKTPIYDIKPYLKFTDSRPNAVCGFADEFLEDRLEVFIPENIKEGIPDSKIKSLIQILRSDPRPSYQNDPDRIYGFEYSNLNIKFKVSDSVLTVTDIQQIME